MPFQSPKAILASLNLDASPVSLPLALTTVMLFVDVVGLQIDVAVKDIEASDQSFRQALDRRPGQPHRRPQQEVHRIGAQGTSPLRRRISTSAMAGPPPDRSR